MQDEGVNYNVDAVLEVLEDLNTLVISLDKLGSASHDMTEAEYLSVEGKFLDDWEVYKLISNARYVLGKNVREGSEIGKLLASRLDVLEHWSWSNRQPSKHWRQKIKQRHEKNCGGIE